MHGSICYTLFYFCFRKAFLLAHVALGHNNVIISSNNTGSYKSSKLTPPAPESCFLLTYNQTLTQTNYTAVTIVLKTTTCCCFQSSRVDFYTAILLEAKVSKKSTHEVLRIQYCGFLRLSSRRSTSLPNICASFAAASSALSVHALTGYSVSMYRVPNAQNIQATHCFCHSRRRWRSSTGNMHVNIRFLVALSLMTLVTSIAGDRRPLRTGTNTVVVNTDTLCTFLLCGSFGASALHGAASVSYSSIPYANSCCFRIQASPSYHL